MPACLVSSPEKAVPHAGSYKSEKIKPFFRSCIFNGIFCFFILMVFFCNLVALVLTKVV
jgi:hypothetical protein